MPERERPATRARRAVRAIRGRRRIAATVAAGVAVAGLIVGAVLTLADNAPRPRARQYRAFTACLLTDAHGLSGKPAAAAWEGMQKASLTTHVKVQYLPAFGAADAVAAAPYLTTLVHRHCDLIVASDDVSVAVVMARARHYRKTQFIVVGAPGSGPNVVAITAAPDRVPAEVAKAISRSAHAT
ncbi:MAG TPA: hypothetical protein VF069_07700 [Streptosporangiaceae bacterium]